MDSSLALADKVEYFAHTPFALEHLLIGSFDEHGVHGVLTSMTALFTAEGRNHTITVSSMEKFNHRIGEICSHLRGLYDHRGPISCIACISPTDTPDIVDLGMSPWRRDINGVWIKVIRGKKIVEFENGASSTQVELAFDGHLMIAAGTRYRFVNKEPSISLAFTLERFLEDRVI